MWTGSDFLRGSLAAAVCCGQGVGELSEEMQDTAQLYKNRSQPVMESYGHEIPSSGKAHSLTNSSLKADCAWDGDDALPIG
jgi:hypothetical protein